MKYKDAMSPHGLRLIADWCKDGYNDKEIAAKLEITPVTLARWRARNGKLIATMAAARGKGADMPAPKKSKTDASTPKLYKPAIARATWNLATVKQTIDQWQYERRRDNMPLTRESICYLLGINIADFARIVEGGNISAPPSEMSYNAVTETIQPAIVDMLRSCDRAILSDLADRCAGRNSIGAIFLLKNNYGYTDKRALDITDSDYTVRWEQTRDGDGKTYILRDGKD